MKSREPLCVDRCVPGFALVLAPQVAVNKPLRKIFHTFKVGYQYAQKIQKLHTLH